MANKELEKELKELFKEIMDMVNTKSATLEKSIVKYADKKLGK